MMQKKMKQLIVIAIIVSAWMQVFANTQQIPVQNKLANLEEAAGGRLGIYAINIANNQSIKYHAEQRFPVQSTFKVMVVAAILKQSMTDSHLLQQKIKYKKQDILFWSPITEKYISEGMTIDELCAAAMMNSDNTATNLLVRMLGGPKAVTTFARSIRDNKFLLTNWEPNLNSNPIDSNDSSTPAAMAKSLQQLTLGNSLGSTQRQQLVTWMKGNTTGSARIRAGVPRGWIVADKTGSGDYGITNDIGMIWPPDCDNPIVVAIYFYINKKDATRRDDVVASATRILINELSPTVRCDRK